VIELETKLAEVQRKYDDSKKSYFKLKEDREKIKQELDKFKGSSGGATAAAEKDGGDGQLDVSQKYEQLKIKYRVSSSLYVAVAA